MHCVSLQSKSHKPKQISSPSSLAFRVYASVMTICSWSWQKSHHSLATACIACLKNHLRSVYTQKTICFTSRQTQSEHFFSATWAADRWKELGIKHLQLRGLIDELSLTPTRTHARMRIFPLWLQPTMERVGEFQAPAYWLRQDKADSSTELVLHANWAIVETQEWCLSNTCIVENCSVYTALQTVHSVLSTWS